MSDDQAPSHMTHIESYFFELLLCFIIYMTDTEFSMFLTFDSSFMFLFLCIIWGQFLCFFSYLSEDTQIAS